MSKVRIVQLSCGPEYSGVQNEIAEAAQSVDAEIFFPDLKLADIRPGFDRSGLDVRSPDLKLAIARARALVEGKVEADAVFIATCFRCAEAAIVRNELRRYIQENSRLPVVSYSFTERTTAGTLLTRMEALTTIARRRALLAREAQEGITMRVDSGSSTTKAVVMQNNQIIGTGWLPTTAVLKSAEDVIDLALQEAGMTRGDIQATGTMVTNITELDSALFVKGDPVFLSRIRYPESGENVYMLKGILSRKKQLVPCLTELIRKGP